MERASFSALRGSHGSVQFVTGATTARLADEMFSLGVVLLVRLLIVVAAALSLMGVAAGLAMQAAGRRRAARRSAG